eukprot:11361702-Alexandrium_andersonii.AAC.1
MAFLPAAPVVLPAWPVAVPVALKDLASEMALESIDTLVRQPERLTEAIVDQWVADGGVRDQVAVDAAHTL